MGIDMDEYMEEAIRLLDAVTKELNSVPVYKGTTFEGIRQALSALRKHLLTHP